MDPGRKKLKSSSTGTGLEAPGQQCLSNWEMERTPVDDFLLVDRTSDLGGTAFSPEELVIGAQPDGQISTSFPTPKTVFLQMSCKAEDTKELANEENKRFDPVPGG